MHRNDVISRSNHIMCGNDVIIPKNDIISGGNEIKKKYMALVACFIYSIDGFNKDTSHLLFVFLFFNKQRMKRRKSLVFAKMPLW